MKTIVTAGEKNADIDVLACAIAYAELLNLEGKEAIAVVPGQFTMSVTPSILEWGAKYQSRYISDGSENFVLVDVSDPDYFAKFVNPDKVVEVYDHRVGHEDYWKEKIGENSHIEMIGACGTLIWEEFKKRGQAGNISKSSARLLIASIISNTLDFKSPLTISRDRNAYAELNIIAKLSDDWIPDYFSEQEKILSADFDNYFRADIKIFKIGSSDLVIGQIELWEAEELLNLRKEDIHRIMKEYEPLAWIVNVLNISKGFNYIFSKSESGKKIIEEKLSLRFDNDIVVTKELLLRKYIMKIIKN